MADAVEGITKILSKSLSESIKDFEVSVKAGFEKQYKLLSDMLSLYKIDSDAIDENESKPDKVVQIKTVDDKPKSFLETDMTKSKDFAKSSDLVQLHPNFGLPSLFLGSLLSSKNTSDSSYLKTIADNLINGKDGNVDNTSLSDMLVGSFLTPLLNSLTPVNSIQATSNTKHINELVIECIRHLHGIGTLLFDILNTINKKSVLKNNKESNSAFMQIEGPKGLALTDKKEKEEKKSKDPVNSVSGFFKGIIKDDSGIGVLVVALVAVSVALLLFMNIDWLNAIANALLFTGFLFIIGKAFNMFNKVFKVSQSDLDAITDFGYASGLISLSFLIFGLAIKVIGNITAADLGKTALVLAGVGIIFGIIYFIAFKANFLNKSGAFNAISKASGNMMYSLKDVLLALLASVILTFIWPIALKGFFIIALAFGVFMLLSRLLKDNNESFKDFGAGVSQISYGLLAFSVSLLIMVLISKIIDLNATIIVLTIIGAFIAGTVLISMVVKESLPDIKQLAIGLIWISASLIVLSLALLVMVFVGSIINNNIFILSGPIIIAGLLTGFIILGKLANKGKADILALGLISIIISISLVLFSIALLAIAKVGENATDALKGLGLVTITMAAFLVLGFFLSPANPAFWIIMSGLVGLTAISVLMAVSFLLLSKSLLSLAEAERAMQSMDATSFVKNTAMIIDGFGNLLIPSIRFLAASLVLVPAFLALGIISSSLLSVTDMYSSLSKLDAAAISTNNEKIKSIFTNFGELKDIIKKSAGNINTTSLNKDISNLSKSLIGLSSLNDMNLDSFGSNIDISILDPLSKLEEQGVQKVESVVNSFKNLNKELIQLRDSFSDLDVSANSVNKEDKKIEMYLKSIVDNTSDISKNTKKVDAEKESWLTNLFSKKTTGEAG